MTTLHTAWGWVTQTSSPPTLWLAGTAFLLGVVIAVYPLTWTVTRNIATWIHEAGHAVVAVAAGRRLSGMRIHTDTSGETSHVGRPGLGLILTTAAGYPAPAAAAFGIVAGIFLSHTNTVVAVLLTVAAVLLPFQRNLLGFLWTCAAVVFAGAVIALPTTVGQVALLTLAGFLTAASPRMIVELHQVRGQLRRFEPGDEGHSDADALARYTFLPPVVWEAVFLTGCAAFLWGSATVVFG